MKRIFLIGLITLLAFAFACGKPAENAAEQANISWNFSDPPEMVFFNSIEEYRKFAASLELSDTELRNFIDSSHYVVNGIQTKEDVKNVLNVMDSMPVPTIDGFDFDSASLRFDIGTFYILYKNNAAQSSYIGFNMSIAKSKGDADLESDKKLGQLVDIHTPKDSEFNYLVRADKNDIRNVNTYYFTNIRSHRIELITNLSGDDFLDALNNCQFTTMDEYAKKAAP